MCASHVHMVMYFKDFCFLMDMIVGCCFGAACSRALTHGRDPSLSDKGYIHLIRNTVEYFDQRYCAQRFRLSHIIRIYYNTGCFPYF